MFTSQDLAAIGFLAFLEGILSIDNALVLALLAKPLPPHLQRKALTYGLVGAVVFRLIALGLTTYLMKWLWVKWVGGGYLVWVAGSHFLKKKEKDSDDADPTAKAAIQAARGSKWFFWKTVLVIELTDIAFAVDSILAAVALSNKFWVVFTGGLMGVILMRVAANIFITLIEKFPRMEITAYLLVMVIGIKLLLDAAKLPGVDFHSSSSPAFWIFWATMLSSLAVGLTRPKKASGRSAKQ
ncbi:MAG: TerC family protein [Oligoflexia bacterium]|jgi:YkoY family integral membrane protein